MAVLLAGLLATTGCAGSDEERPAANAPALAKGLTSPKLEDAPTGKYGGTMTLPAYEPPRTFNPTLASDAASARALAYVFDGLVEEDGQTYEIEPLLAESWRVSPDGKRYTFTLRPGLTWHDGKPLTADDVVFTVLNVLPHPGIPWEARHALQIDGRLPKATKIDARTVRFDLPAPFAPFLRAIAGTGLPILPKHIFAPWLKAHTDDGRPLADTQWDIGSDVSRVVGSGPFMLEAYQPGRALTFKRNPRYFRVNRYHQPLPYFDRLTLKFYTDRDTAMRHFKTGETDAQWLPAKAYASLKGEAKGIRLYDGGPDFRLAYMAFNLNPGRDKAGRPLVDPVKLKWFADARFRRAIAYALDRQTLVKEVYQGLAVPQNSPVFQKSPYYDAAMPPYGLDRAKARQLLKEAGFHEVKGVLQDAGNHPVRFSLLFETGAPETQAQVRRIQADLKALGITVQPQGVPFKTKVDRTYQQRRWECQIGAWSAGVDPHGTSQLWLSNGLAHIFNLNPATTPHSRPTYAWEKRVDQLFVQGAETLDEGQRKRLYSEFQRLVGREQPMIFLPVFRYTVALRDSLGNARPSAYSPLGASWNVYELYRR